MNLVLLAFFSCLGVIGGVSLLRTGVDGIRRERRLRRRLPPVQAHTWHVVEPHVDERGRGLVERHLRVRPYDWQEDGE